MSDSITAYYDDLRAREYEQRRILKQKRVQIGGCSKSLDGVHCGHSSVRVSRIAAGGIEVRCCYCDSRIQAKMKAREKQVFGHGEYFTKTEYEIEFINADDKKIWKIDDESRI